MTMCLPWRTMRKPPFSNARTARRREYTVRGRRWIDCIGRMVMRPRDREIASQFSALLDRHFHFADVGTTEAFIDSSKIILNGIANVLHRFLLGFSLRPTTGKRGAIHRVTFFRLMKHDLISETHRRTLYRERHKSQRTLCQPNLAGSPRFQHWRAIHMEFTRRGGQHGAVGRRRLLSRRLVTS